LPPTLPIYYQVPEFSLRDENGKNFGSKTLWVGPILPISYSQVAPQLVRLNRENAIDTKKE